MSDRMGKTSRRASDGTAETAHHVRHEHDGHGHPGQGRTVGDRAREPAICPLALRLGRLTRRDQQIRLIKRQLVRRIRIGQTLECA